MVECFAAKSVGFGGFAPSLSWTQFNVWVCMFVSVTGGQPFIQRRDAFCVWVDAAVELRLGDSCRQNGFEASSPI